LIYVYHTISAIGFLGLNRSVGIGKYENCSYGKRKNNVIPEYKVPEVEVATSGDRLKLMQTRERTVDRYENPQWGMGI
jgi:hypothetical protein